MLLGGAPHLVAAAYALIGWHLVVAGTAMLYVSLDAALDGELAALMPLPVAIVAFSLATHSLRRAAEAIRSVIG